MEACLTRSVQVFVILSLLVVGLSHAFRPSAWAAYFALLRRHGAAGVMVNGMMALAFGAFIVAFHNVWSGPAALVTLVGWAQVLKGVLHLCVPGIGERSLALVEKNGERKFRIAGAVMSVLAIAMGVALFALE